jgi:hypothetical protein
LAARGKALDDPDLNAVLEEFAALELWPVNQRAWLAWSTLAGSRPSGFGAGAIPLSEIGCWFRMKGLPVDWLLVEKIQAIDQAFLADQAARAERKQEAARLERPVTRRSRRR